MKKTVGILVAILATTTVCMASVVVDFTPLYESAKLSVDDIVLDFSADGSGNVTLAASSISGVVWQNKVLGTVLDGVVGTVGASMAGATWTLTGTSASGTTDKLSWDEYAVGDGSTLGIDDVNILYGTGVSAYAGGPEGIIWTLTDATGIDLTFLSFDYNRSGDNNDNAQLVDGDTTVDYDLTTLNSGVDLGSVDISSDGLVLSNTDTLTFQTHPTLDIWAGYGIQGFSFDAIPEPATIGLFSLSGAVLLLIRRRLMV